MASTGAGLASGLSPFSLRKEAFRTKKFKSNHFISATATTASQQSHSSIGPSSVNGAIGSNEKHLDGVAEWYDDSTAKDEKEERRFRLKNYFELSKEMIRSSDGGPPRWFSPLECASRSQNSPLLLYLPGIDGVGFGLSMHHRKLGKIFDIWCLHIPVMDRTPFKDLVMLVEKTLKSEHSLSPNLPIYIVGESLGACLALSVAARNPGLDLVLILANPATSFSRSQLQPLLPLIGLMPEQLNPTLPYILSVMTGIPLKMVMATLEKGLPLQQAVGEVSETVGAISSYLSVLSNVLPRETLLWKLQLLTSASAFANSRLHAVKAQTLILSSGMDFFLPSQEEGERLRRVLPKCEIRRFSDSGHALFLEDDVDLVTIIKGASFYRRARYRDWVLDYIPPTPSELKKIFESVRLTELATAPVMLSTLEDGKIVKGLAGIPSEGPVLYVGYHMLLGLELSPMVARFMTEKNILLRGLAHPMIFRKLRDGKFPELENFDLFRIMGAVPVSATNFFRLFASNSHILLYPGGMREALHRKGEEYKLIWPEQSEFVRMAVRFGATIVPFGVVGEDDIGQILLDYDDLMKIPYFKGEIEGLTEEIVKLRVGVGGEVGNQDVHLPIIAPKVPGRFYYLFGKPIETRGRKKELKNREKAHELYLEVKSEVESCINFLKEKREHDPYRSIIPRIIYQAAHCFDTEVPTFEL